MLIISNKNTSLALKKSEYDNKLINIRYDFLNQIYNNNFDYLHDLLHQCLDLKRTLKKEDYTSLSNKLDELIDKTHQSFNSIYSNSVILNCIINNKIDLIKKEKIRIAANIDDKNLSILDINTQLELFNYLLETAISHNIEAKVNHNKIISFKDKIIGKQLILKVQFTFHKNKVTNNTIKTNIEKILKNNTVALDIDILETENNIKDIIIRL